MAAKVLDSWAPIAFFEGESAADAVEHVLRQAADGRHRLFMSVINWGEIYYSTMREVSQQAAEQRLAELASLPIQIVGVGDDLVLAKQAAVFKATKKMSYADCFGHSHWRNEAELGSLNVTAHIFAYPGLRRRRLLPITPGWLHG